MENVGTLLLRTYKMRLPSSQRDYVGIMHRITLSMVCMRRMVGYGTHEAGECSEKASDGSQRFGTPSHGKEVWPRALELPHRQIRKFHSSSLVPQSSSCLKFHTFLRQIYTKRDIEYPSNNTPSLRAWQNSRSRQADMSPKAGLPSNDDIGMRNSHLVLWLRWQCSMAALPLRWNGGSLCNLSTGKAIPKIQEVDLLLSNHRWRGYFESSRGEGRGLYGTSAKILGILGGG